MQPSCQDVAPTLFAYARHAALVQVLGTTRESRQLLATMPEHNLHIVPAPGPELGAHTSVAAAGSTVATIAPMVSNAAQTRIFIVSLLTLNGGGNGTECREFDSWAGANWDLSKSELIRHAVRRKPRYSPG